MQKFERGHPERITKSKNSMGRYIWQRINYPSKEDDWKRFAKRNLTIAINILHAKKEKVYHSYVLKYNSKRQK